MRGTIFISVIAILSLLCSLSLSEIVRYTETPECAKINGGCDFMTPTLWSTGYTPNATSQVIIDSTVPITIFVNSTRLTLWSLSFGKGNDTFVSEVVDIVVFDSNIEVVGTSDTVLEWGGGGPNITDDKICSLSLTKSSLTVIESQECGGGNLNLVNSTFTSLDYIGANLYSTNSSVQLSTAFLTVYSGINNQIVIYEIKCMNMTSLGDAFTLFQKLKITANGTAVINTPNIIITDVWMEAGSSIDFYDTSVTITNSITEFTSSFIGFYSTLKSGITEVDIHTAAGSLIVLGDNVSANINYGKINQLNLGDGVTLKLGDVAINNIQNEDVDSSATIDIYDYTRIINGSLRSTVVIEDQAQLRVAGSLALISPNNYNGDSILSGKGQLMVTGNLSCDTSIIVEQVILGGTITANLEISSLDITTYLPIQSNAVINGDLTITGAQNMVGVNIGSHSLNVNGNFVQSSGEIKVTIQEPQNTSFIEVTGFIAIEGFDVNVTFPNGYDDLLVDARNWTFAQSSSFNSTVSAVTAIDNSYSTKPLSIHNSNGTIVISYEPHKGSSTKESIWHKIKEHMIPIIIGGVAFVIVIIIIVSVVVVRYRRKNGYQKLDHHL